LEGENRTAPSDLKENRIYFFQFPPLLPSLSEGDALGEASNPITLGEGIAELGLIDVKPSLDNMQEQYFPPGRVGKLNVHRSGRVSLTWGGIKMTVSKGQYQEFLQDAVYLDPGEIPLEGSNDLPDPGKVSSLGAIAGRYVVTPDWESLLG
jgi:DNA-directed RNA polymerase III subunit RPC4